MYSSTKLMFQDPEDEPSLLNWEKYPKAIQTLIESRSFFVRFKQLKKPEHKEVYLNVIKNTQVEIF